MYNYIINYSPENGQWHCSFTYLLTLTVMIISSSALLTLWVSDLSQQLVHTILLCHRGDCMGKKTVCVCVCTHVRTYVCNNHEDVYHRLWYEVTKFFMHPPNPPITGYYMNLQVKYVEYHIRLQSIRRLPPPPSTFPQDL